DLRATVMLSQNLFKQIGHQPVLSAAAIVGREPHVDAEPLEVFDASEILSRASAIAEGDVQGPRHITRRIAVALLMERLLSQREERRLPDSAGDHDEVLGGDGGRMRRAERGVRNAGTLNLEL